MRCMANDTILTTRVMSPRSETKALRRMIQHEHVMREYVRTGRNAYEQWLDSIANLAPVHMKINRRAEKELEKTPWRPGD